MKNLRLILFLLLLVPATGHATKIVGNGGDTYAIEFVSTAEEVHKYLQASVAGIVDAKTFGAAVLNTKVESTDGKLVLDGAVKDAINYPSLRRIVFSRGRWTNMTDHERAVLVLHEYLGILQIKDASYQRSKKILANMNFNRAVVVLNDSISVNFASETEYSLQARVSVFSIGIAAWKYNSADEKVRLLLESNGERKLFDLSFRGRVLAVANANDGIDSGLYIKVLQPVRSPSGRLEEFEDQREFSVYVKHVVKEYLIQFHSRVRQALPETIEVHGPISNQAT